MRRSVLSPLTRTRSVISPNQYHPPVCLMGFSGRLCGPDLSALAAAEPRQMVSGARGFDMVENSNTSGPERSKRIMSHELRQGISIEHLVKARPVLTSGRSWCFEGGLEARTSHAGIDNSRWPNIKGLHCSKKD